MLIKSRLTPQFRFDTRTQRYITADNRFVSRETVKAASEAVKQQAEREIEAVSLRFYNGEINHADWDASMRNNIRISQVASETIAAGGFEQMTPAKYGRSGANCREQYDYLNGMGQRIQDGYYGPDLKSGNFMGHAKMYASAARQSFEYAQAMNNTDVLGHDQICNELDGSVEHHCTGKKSCRAMTDLDWIDIDSDDFKDVWLWPGDRLCIGQCQCRVKTRKAPDKTSLAESSSSSNIATVSSDGVK